MVNNVTEHSSLVPDNVHKIFLCKIMEMNYHYVPLRFPPPPLVLQSTVPGILSSFLSKYLQGFEISKC